jgi:putative flippase GtrA
VTVGNILINYFGLKLFVEVFQWWPTVSYVIISVICVTFSYLTNKFYSFRKEKKAE